MYVEDNDGEYPYFEEYLIPTAANNYSTSIDWTGLVNPYVKTGSSQNNNGYYFSGVWSCPDFRDVNETNQYKVLDNTFREGCTDVNYSCGDAPAPNAPLNESKMPSPSAHVLVFEGGANFPSGGQWGYPSTSGQLISWATPWYAGGPFGVNSEMHTDLADSQGDCDNTPATAGAGPANYYNGSPATYCNVTPRYRHAGMTNILWADTHVSSIHKGTLNWFDNIALPNYEDGSTECQSWMSCSTLNGPNY
jgi:prepilin-type processing-associated H-X9-DG protein